MLKLLAQIKVKDQTRCEIKASADTAEIKIIGEISWWKNNSEEFTRQMEAIKAAGITKLKCYINSGGGSVWDANEIYNQLFAFEGEKDLEIGAICASAATIPAMAFEKERTTGASNMAYMIHNPRTNVFDAEEKDLETGIQLLKNTKETISKLYQKRTGMSKTAIANKMSATWWMTAEMAKENGFIGKIKGESDALPEDTGDVFNRYKFDNVPSVLNTALNTPPVAETPKENETFTITMKDFLTLLLATVTGLTNFIKADASNADIVAGLSKAFADKDSQILNLTNSEKTLKEKITKLEADAKTQADLMIKNALDAAETSKKITKDQRAEFEKQAEKIGLDGLTAILNTLTPRASVKDALQNDGKGKKDEGKKDEGKDDDGGEGKEILKPKNSAQGISLKMAQMNAKNKK